MPTMPLRSSFARCWTRIKRAEFLVSICCACRAAPAGPAGELFLNLIVGDLRIPIELDGMPEYVRVLSGVLGIPAENIRVARLLCKTLDIRDKEQFYYDISLLVAVPDNFVNKDKFSVLDDQISLPPAPARRSNARPVIIGFGPAGMFAALELLERGIPPLIFERGRKIEERLLDIREFIQKKTLNEESNIQFGEGGAGAYSDGKLFSRADNSRHVKKVLDTFIRFGAPPEIAYIAKPHVGTDVLCAIARNIRNYILERGGEIVFNSRLTDILLVDGAVSGAVINGEKEYRCAELYLAVGHSARDTFKLLLDKGFALEQRPVAVGLRIEHPAGLINSLRYGEKYKNYPGLGAATYSFNYTDRALRRGAYTFCMCPGGEVVNASSSNGLLAVNGMSASRRDSPFSNAALVVTTHAGDYGSASALAGLEFQKTIERKAFAAGGGNWQVPAQTLPDFLRGASSYSLPENSCATGTAPADMREILPEFVCGVLSDAFAKWKEEAPLFVSDQALLLGPETRTSCPVKILRGENYQSVSCRNLYPIGEGAGYAGGITSSATDAIKAVESRFAPV